MPESNSVSGSRTTTVQLDSSVDVIIIIQKPEGEPELQAPDPAEMFWPHPADGIDPPPTTQGGGIPPLPVANNNPPAGVEPPDAGAPLPPERKKAGLGSRVDDILNLSPSMRRLLEKAQSENWQIKERPGQRSEANDRVNPKTIFINPKEVGPGGDWSAKLTALLAHELGHAERPYPELPEGRNREDFAQKCVELALLHEGAAAFANARARDEILENGGPDIEIRGKFDEKYIDVYDDYKNGRITEDEAIRQMARIQGDEPEETRPDGTTPTRREAFEKEYQKVWEDMQSQ